MDMICATLLIILGIFFRVGSLLAGIGDGTPASGCMPMGYRIGKIMMLIGFGWWLLICVMWGLSWLT